MTALSAMDAGFVSHVAAALAYLVLLALAICWCRRSFTGVLLAVASAATSLWAAVTAYYWHPAWVIQPAAEVLAIVPSCTWMILLLAHLYWLPPAQRAGIASALIGLCVCVASLIVFFSNGRGFRDAHASHLVAIGAQLSFTIIGLGLVENLFRNSSESDRWRIKYLCLAVGGLFAYDFYVYSDALLFYRLDPDLLDARSATRLVVVPLLALYAVRSRRVGPQVSIARRLPFYSATLLAAGLYLVAMASAAYYVREFGGSWSSFLQAVFMFGAALLFCVPLLSASFRGYFRVIVEKSFFQSKYDYRAEWQRFIRCIARDDAEPSLHRRVIRAVGNIVDSPEGGVWLRRRAGDYVLAGTWNMSRWVLEEGKATIPSGSGLPDFLQRTEWVVDLDEYHDHRDRYDGLATLPEWLVSARRAWLVVPLFQHETLFGIMILGRSRVPQELGWETLDLLKTVARQAASYLAEKEASDALVEARQFEAFNKRFAFVVHDVKNMASQLSLILSNAARHRENAQFQDDMIATVRQSVEKMNRMLKQLSTSAAPPQAPRPVPLAPLLAEVVATQSRAGAAVSLEIESKEMAVAANADRLKAVVEHLVQNAVDAVGDEGQVRVRLTGDGATAMVEVEDNGPGMDPDFIRDELFRPFATTKSRGYGIGAYETREFAESLGGRLEVTSRPGRGTIMRMRLPAAVSGVGASLSGKG